MRSPSRLSLLALLAALPILAQAGPQRTATPGPDDHHDRKPDDVFRLQPLGNDVYALYGRGGNVGFFVGPEAVTVIDSQFKELGLGIIAQIKNVTNKPIRFLINTHHHGDHTGGNEAFRQFAMIVAHDNVRTRMLASPETIKRDYPAMIEKARKKGDEGMVKTLSDLLAWANQVKVEDIPAPVLTFDSELRIHPGNGETIQVWHLPPAHTDGDSVVYFEKAKVLHMGDDFFNKVIPFIDVQGGGSARGYLAAIDMVIARVPAEVVVIPGHGEVTTLSGLKDFRQYISDVVDAAARAKAAGKSKEQFLEGLDLPAYKDFRGYKERLKDNAAAAYDEIR